MRKFKKVILGSASILAAGLLAACGNSGNSEEVKESTEVTSSDKPIKFWTSSSSFEERALAYAEEAGLDIEVTFIPVADIQTKLKQSITSPSTSPDVFAVGRDFVSDWTQNPEVVVNLSETFGDELAVYEDASYQTFLSTGSAEDSIYGITDQFPVGMMYYNRDVAMEVLGTDDYQEVASQLDSFDKIIALNDKLPEGVKMFGTFQNLSIANFTSRTEPWVNENNELIIDSFFHDYMELSKTLYEEGMILSEVENDVYFSGYQTGSFFLDYIPTWGYRSKVKPQIEEANATANWGITYPTVDYLRGGSYYFISEASENKAGAWELIKGMALNEDNLTDFYSEVYDLSALTTVNERLYESKITEEGLGGQEIFKVYGEQAERVSETFGDAAPISIYDFSVNEFLRVAAVNYATGHMTKEEALEDFTAQFTSAYPEITVINE